MIRTIRDQRGFFMVEILVSIAVLLLFSVAIGGLVVANARATTVSAHETQAVALAKESVERVIAVKQAAWSGVLVPSPTSKYVLQEVALPAPHYALVADAAGTGETIDGFVRTVSVTTGMRTESGTLDAAGTVPDPAVRLVTATVAWDERGTERHVTLSTYLTNWKGES